MPCNRLLRSAKRVAKAKTENGKEGCVAEVVVIMRNELGQTLLKASILVHGFTPDCQRLYRIACASGERNFESRLANIVEPCLYRKAEMAAGARDYDAPVRRKVGRNFSKVNRSGSVERIGSAADVILSVQRDGAARRHQCRRPRPIVIEEHDHGTQPKPVAEGKPIQRCVAGLHTHLDGDVRPLILEGGGVTEIFGSCADVEFSRQWRRQIPACASQSPVQADTHPGKWGIVSGQCGRGSGPYKILCASSWAAGEHEGQCNQRKGPCAHESSPDSLACVIGKQRLAERLQNHNFFYTLTS